MVSGWTYWRIGRLGTQRSLSWRGMPYLGLLMWISRGRLCLHFVEASRGDLADTVCEEFGSELVFDAALSVPGDQAEVARRYAEKAFFLMEDRKKVVTNTLGRAGVKVDRNLIHLFSENVTPDVPKCKGRIKVDPWVAIWNNGDRRNWCKKRGSNYVFFDSASNLGTFLARGVSPGDFVRSDIGQAFGSEIEV